MNKINPYKTVLENLEYRLRNELVLTNEEFEELKNGTFKMDFKTAQYLEAFLGGGKTFWINLYNHRPSGTGTIK